MPGITDTQAIRFGYVTDPISYTMIRDEADDIAAQLDAADASAAVVLQSPAAIVRRNAALPIAVSTLVAVPWDVEVEDTHAMVDIAGQPQRLTASAAAGAGLYTVQFLAQTDTTSWTRGDVVVNKNGAFYCRKTYRAPQPFDYMQLTVQMHLGVVGDYVSFQMFHEGGGTTNLIEAYAYIFKIANN
jgi:hypothetical protein